MASLRHLREKGGGLRQQRLSVCDHDLGKSCQSGDMNPITMTGYSWEHFVEEGDLTTVVAHLQTGIPDCLAGVGYSGDFMIMGGENRLGAHVPHQVPNYRPGDGQAVGRSRPTADLIEDNQASR